mgnify:CR=1 FL=1|jgi:hypothetical protein
MAETSTTTNMNLVLPTPGERLGPVWATDLNTALTAIDAHDHSSGKGVQINNAGITVNADFDFRKSGTAYPIINLHHASFIKQTGHPAVNNDVYVFGSGTVGDLWFRNNNGVNVQITSGTSVYLPASGDSANIFPIRTGGPVSGTHSIAGTSSETVILVDTTSAPCTVTLPDTTAAGMNSGRFYVIKDISGNSATNNITVQRTGTSDTIDGQTSVVMNSNYEAVYFHFAAALTWARI